MKGQTITSILCVQYQKSLPSSFDLPIVQLYLSERLLKTSTKLKSNKDGQTYTEPQIETFKPFHFMLFFVLVSVMARANWGFRILLCIAIPNLFAHLHVCLLFRCSVFCGRFGVCFRMQPYKYGLPSLPVFEGQLYRNVCSRHQDRITYEGFKVLHFTTLSPHMPLQNIYYLVRTFTFAVDKCLTRLL